jgi:sugar phosphate isomerase/epimerase
MTEPKVGIQAIIFGEEFTDDTARFLRLAREAGFCALEAGPMLLEPYEDSELQALLQESQIELYGIHGSTERFQERERLKMMCVRAKKLGCRHIITSGLHPGSSGRDAYRITGRLLHELVKIVGDNGLTLNYHHYDFELTEAWDKGYALGYLLNEAGPSVGLVIDTFWAEAAEVRSTLLWDTYGHLCKVVHLKDGIPHDRRFTPLGEGEVDVLSAFEFFSAQPIDYLTYEQDFASTSTIELCVKKSGEWIAERRAERERKDRPLRR